MADFHDAALRAAVFQVIEKRAAELKDAAKAELQALEPGDAVAGRWNGRTVGKASMVRGRTRIAVTDQRALLEWVKRAHPTEVVESVNPAFMSTLMSVSGVVVDAQGEFADGCEVTEGAPSIRCTLDRQALEVVGDMLAAGLIELDGLKTIEAADGI